MDDRARRVEEELREGLYLLSIGHVLEGRRAWRRALDIAPGHPVLEDYLSSTDSELTPSERASEEAELLGAGQGIELEGWDEEVTGELDSLWGARGTPPTQVTPPGEGAETLQGEFWELGPEAGWDVAGAAIDQPLSPIPGPDATPWRQGEPPWNDDTPTEVGRSFPDRETLNKPEDDITSEIPLGLGAEKDRSQDSPEELLGKGVAAFHQEDFTAARAHLDALLAVEPGNSTALDYRRQIRSTLAQRLTSEAIPERIVEVDAISRMNLDMVEGYIISRIDGHTNIEDLFALSAHLDPDRVTEILCSLLEQGVIQLRPG